VSLIAPSAFLTAPPSDGMDSSKSLSFLCSVVIVSTLSWASFQIKLVRPCSFPAFIGSIGCEEVPHTQEPRSGKSGACSRNSGGLMTKVLDESFSSRRRLTIQEPDLVSSRFANTVPAEASTDPRADRFSAHYPLEGPRTARIACIQPPPKAA
jgi:hypothetical protein